MIASKLKQLTSEQIEYKEDELLTGVRTTRNKNFYSFAFIVCDVEKVKVSKKLSIKIAMEISVMEPRSKLLPSIATKVNI